METAAELGRPVLPLSVISLYRKPSPLRDWLTGYKGSADGAEPPVADYRTRVRALLGRFLLEHGSALAGRVGGVDAVVVVPSTDRPPPHPLTEVVDSLRLDVPTVGLLRRGPGVLGFRRPAVDGYQVISRSPAHVLLLDDVYTTGARANSAAYALETAGHRVAGLLVIARRVNPDFHERARALWDAQSAAPYDWTKSPALAASSTSGAGLTCRSHT